MTTILPKPVRLWGHGQLTIPKDMRELLSLNQESQLNIFLVGQCMILTPKRLVRSGLAKDIEKSMKSQGLTLNDLLKDLKKERRRYFGDVHDG